MIDNTIPEWKQRYSAALMNTYGPPRLMLARGSGARVWDTEGREYIDLLGGIAVNVLGHGHPALVDAVTNQLQTLGHVSNFFTTRPQLELAERLLELLHPQVELQLPQVELVETGRVFFTNSGTEANEAALKATRRTGRTRLVAAEGAFHGRTMGSLALTAKSSYRSPFEPLPGDVTFVPYGDVDALRAAVTDQTAALVLEPIQGEAGVVVPPPGYLSAARDITAEHGALLWLDEIQTGIGRTGAWFAHADASLSALSGQPALVRRPDIVTVAKGLGGGFPIGACIALGDAATLLEPGNHGTTFGGNPVACAAALAVLDTIVGDGLLDHATALGEHLRAGLAADPRVSEVRGRGLLIGLTLTEPESAAVTQAAQRRGFIVNNPTPDRIRLAPPLVLTRGEADAFLDTWPGILDDAHIAKPDHEGRH